MKTLSFLKIAAVATLMLVGVSVAAPAQAAVGNWNSTANGPTIYQTNYLYHSSWMSAPASVPSTAITTSVSWSIKFSNYYPVGLESYINPASGGYYGPLPGNSGYAGFYGLSAKQSFRYGFYVRQSTTYLLASVYGSPAYGGGHQMNINYEY